MKFLIVDDNPTDRELMVQRLRREFPEAEFVEIFRAQAFDEAMARGDFDVVLTDYQLHWTDGLWVVTTLRARLPHVPIIMVTDSGGEEIAVKGMKAGLNDYVLKKDPYHLPMAVKESIEKARLRKAHDQAMEALSQAKQELEATVAERTRALQQLNEALRADLAERHRVEEALKAALQEKELLFKEMHHRIKNNLQVISSLLSLQSGSSEDPQVRKIFQDSQARIYSMALLHETLQGSRDLARVDLADYLHRLVAELCRSYGTEAQPVTIQTQFAEVWVSTDTAIPCGLILNELLSNALKYAFPQGQQGNISIALRADPGQEVTLTVKDAGVGLPAGLDFRDSDSLGLQLVCLLTEQLGGTIALERSGGTAFAVTFPLESARTWGEGL
ncbi:MAG TPA: histidine kinase dimerization/phosphoacceptor domain -containing protein [Candidatus Tectomicrobia bacterium]|nr:histidine kinase dimerization/phosphoacceptor domain -containing protein [Candidatus Tectomicrobia bacterium]